MMLVLVYNLLFAALACFSTDSDCPRGRRCEHYPSSAE